MAEYTVYATCDDPAREPVTPPDIRPSDGLPPGGEEGQVLTMGHDGPIWAAGGGSGATLYPTTGQSTTGGMTQKAITDELNRKATSASVTVLEGAVATKASQADLTALSTEVTSKASQADLTSLSAEVAAKASQADLNGKVDKVAGMGLSQNSYTNEEKAIVDGVTAALADKQDTLTAGANITIEKDTQTGETVISATGGGGDDKVFVAEYGVTTAQEIIEYIDSTNEPFAPILIQRGGQYYTVTTATKQNATTVVIRSFATLSGDYYMFTYTVTNGSWSSSSHGFQKLLESGTNIKTVNGESLLGNGNIVIQGSGGSSDWDDITNKPSDLVQDASYVHTDNNYTSAEKSKLAGLSNYDDTALAARVTANETAIANRYTKTETDAKIAEAMTDVDIEHFHVVTALPAVADAEENHEYVLVTYELDGTTIATEEHYLFYDGAYHQRTTAVSLDGYATEQYVDDSVGAKQDALTAGQGIRIENDEIDTPLLDDYIVKGNSVLASVAVGEEFLWTGSDLADCAFEVLYTNEPTKVGVRLEATDDPLHEIKNLYDADGVFIDRIRIEAFPTPSGLATRLTFDKSNATRVNICTKKVIKKTTKVVIDDLGLQGLPTGWGVAESGVIKVRNITPTVSGEYRWDLSGYGFTSTADYNIFVDIVGGTGGFADSIWSFVKRVDSASIYAKGNNSNITEIDFSYALVAKGYGNNRMGGGGDLPAGGTTGQVLTKASNADGDVTWSTPSVGGEDEILFINVNGSNFVQTQDPNVQTMTLSSPYTVAELQANAGLEKPKTLFLRIKEISGGTDTEYWDIPIFSMGEAGYYGGQQFLLDMGSIGVYTFGIKLSGGDTVLTRTLYALPDYASEQYVDTELATKQDALVSGTNIKTVNGNSLLGSGDIQISGSGVPSYEVSNNDNGGNVVKVGEYVENGVTYGIYEFYYKTGALPNTTTKVFSLATLLADYTILDFMDVHGITSTGICIGSGRLDGTNIVVVQQFSKNNKTFTVRSYQDFSGATARVCIKFIGTKNS